MLISTLLAGCGAKNVPIPANNQVADNEELTYQYSQQEINTSVYRLLSQKACGKGVETINAAIEEIRIKDANTAMVWQEFMPFWDQVNEGDYLNETNLPDGLPDDNSLCIVVLGYQLNPDGTMREELIGRLETALLAANKYPNAYVLVTGGGTAAKDATATEADSMALWLMDNGINKDRIIIENRSMTSADNALFSYRIMRDSYPEISNVAIVTSDYHVRLGALLFQAQFNYGHYRDEMPLISVISNAGYMIDNRLAYTVSNQADWLRTLVDIQN